MNCVVFPKAQSASACPTRPSSPRSSRRASPVGPWLAVPHGPGETKLLRNMGLDAPAPVLSQYDWEGGTPFEVQKKTVAMLTTEPRAYVLSGMGTGKTRCPIWAFSYLRSKGLASRHAGRGSPEHALVRLGGRSVQGRAAIQRSR